MRPIRAYRSWSAHRRLAVGVVALLGAFVVLLAVDLVRIAVDLAAGQGAVSDLDLTENEEGIDIAGIAADASSRLEAAHDVAEGSPWLGLVSHLPGIGGQVAGLRELTGSAAELGATAEESAIRIEAALDAADDGPGRVALTDVVLRELDVIEAELADVTVTDRSLVWPLSGLRDRFEEELEETDGELADARSRAGAVGDLLRGPGDYLVLAANNAEMSGGVGMPLSAGVLHIENGELELDDFIQSSDLLPSDHRALQVSPDFDRLYANQGIGYDFRGTTGTPNFPAVGELITQMSARVATGPVEGVFLVDTMALASLVAVAGPIEVAGTTYEWEEVRDELLVGNYQRFETTDRNARVERQGEFAAAAFDAITQRPVDPTILVSLLNRLSHGRHLLAWSPDPTLQELWESIGAHGGLGPESLLVAVENFDANKVDSYVHPGVRIATARLDDGWIQVVISIRVPYPPLPDASPFMLGLSPDTYRNEIDLHYPGEARDLVVYEGEVTARGVDGDSQVVTSMGFSPRNAFRQFTASFELPPDMDELEILPSARAFGSTFDVNGEVFVDALPRVISIAPDSGPSAATRRIAGGTALVLVVGTALAGVLLVRARRLRPRAPRWLVEPPGAL